MVIAYHVIMAHYGFWMPNDPRGSWSKFVRSWELFLAGGPATKLDTRRSVAGKQHDRRLRLEIESELVRTPVILTGIQAKAVGDGFGKFLQNAPFDILAASILQRHTHLVLGRPPYAIEQAANLLKGAATSMLSSSGLRPFADPAYSNGKLPTPWARHQWVCYLNNMDGLRRSIVYVEQNPIKDGKPLQRWPFVKPYHR